jgi:hypothetical protein
MNSSISFQDFENFGVNGPLFIPTNDKTFSSHGFDIASSLPFLKN